MLNTKLIIIDGIPGSGKSTSSQMLAEKLTNANIPNRFYSETEENHPLCIYDCALGDLESKTEAIWFKNRVIELFRAFVDARSHVAEVTIIESWLFQDHLGVALFSGMDMTLLNELAQDLRDILRPLDPAIIYYYQVDVEKNWRWTCDFRGPEFMQDRCALYTDSDFKRAGEEWSRVRDFSCTVINDWGFPRLIIRNEQQEWDRYNQQILDFLQLS